jgi:protein-tyrosine phosphatase
MVCIGNICRSPMAEALLVHRLKERVPGLKVTSAGLGALVGRPADPIAVELMKERGLDISAHRAQQLTEQLVKDAELVLVMDKDQQRRVESQWPMARGRVRRIGSLGDFDVPDPYGRSREAFEKARELIEHGVDELVEKLWGKT